MLPFARVSEMLVAQSALLQLCHHHLLGFLGWQWPNGLPCNCSVQWPCKPRDILVAIRLTITYLCHLSLQVEKNRFSRMELELVSAINNGKAQLADKCKEIEKLHAAAGGLKSDINTWLVKYSDLSK